MKIRDIFCTFITLSIAAVNLVIPAKALENGAYTCTVTPHYRHPVSGVIEDSGGEKSEVLGQSMTEGATVTNGLIEQDGDTLYATVRLSLMDNIEDVEFMVQERGDADFWAVEYDIMKEDFDLNESDFRFEIPSEDCIVRATFYVVPMGRSVIYYIDFSDIRSGTGDFITELKPGVTPEKNEETAAEETSEKPAEDVPDGYVIPESVKNDAEGIVCFDENGNKIDPLNKTTDTAAEEKTDGQKNNYAVPIVIGAAAAIAAGGAGFAFGRKKR